MNGLIGGDWWQFAQAQLGVILRCWLLCGVLLGLEKLRPIQRSQPLGHWLFNLQWLAWSGLISSLILATPVIASGLQSLRHLLGGPYWHLQFAPNVWGYLAAGLSLGLLLDFFYYWMHRLQHTVWLWPQHKVHHSEQSMNASTGHRHHWLEGLLGQLLIWLPLQSVVEIQPVNLGGFLLFIGLWNYFVHLNFRLELGWLTPWLGGPQLHWVHHSCQPEHWDKNFAPYFPIWDVIFGTYCAPKPGEFPPPGLTEGETIQTFSKANWVPFQEWSEAIRQSFKKTAKTRAIR